MSDTEHELDELFKKSSTRERDLSQGESLAELARIYGQAAARFLFRGQWVYKTPEWFDHRLHLLDPSKWWNDFWTMSADNVIQVMPQGAKVLDLCCGDGFYDYWFYRYRASYILAIDNNPEALALAIKQHADAKIRYESDDILDIRYDANYYDTVVIRGAIEHFTEAQQRQIFAIAYRALKPGGWFCGDTPAAKPGQDKLLESHEHEWKDEAEMQAALYQQFGIIHTSTLISTDRTTLFWRCQK